MPSLDLFREKLLATLRDYQSCAVAFSAGIDSTLVAKAAQLALGDAAVAVTAMSPSVAQGEVEQAIELAKLIGIRHQVIHTTEGDNPAYVRNGPDRCYHCKTELYDQIAAIRAQIDVRVVANGANLDDLGDYRPGMQAASEHDVKSPLIDCGIDKPTVRLLAKSWELPIWDKPAMPCLASRVAYGQAVTPERMQMIDQAERFLRERGFRECRVRYHEGDQASVEVASGLLPRLQAEPLHTELQQHLLALGFLQMTVDPSGFRSGRLNDSLPSELFEIETPNP
jgi:uncharacterized protein